MRPTLPTNRSHLSLKSPPRQAPRDTFVSRNSKIHGRLLTPLNHNAEHTRSTPRGNLETKTIPKPHKTARECGPVTSTSRVVSMAAGNLFAWQS